MVTLVACGCARVSHQATGVGRSPDRPSGTWENRKPPDTSPDAFPTVPVRVGPLSRGHNAAWPLGLDADTTAGKEVPLAQ